MNSYLGPRLAEFEKRARLGQALFAYLEELYPDTDKGAVVRIDDIWQAVISRQQDVGHTPYGVRIVDAYQFSLFRKEFMLTQSEDDIIPVLNLYICEQGVFLGDNEGMTREEAGTSNLQRYFSELNSEEIEGLQNDIKGMIS